MQSGGTYTVLQLCAIVGGIVVAVWVIAQFPDDDDIAEGFAISFILIGWIAYCVVASLCSRLAYRFLGRIVLLSLIVGPAIVFALSPPMSWEGIGEWVVQFALFSLVASLPITRGLLGGLRKIACDVRLRKEAR